MPTMRIDVHCTNTDLAGLVALVAAGTEVILAEGDTPVARVVPAEVSRAHRVAGLHPSAMEMSAGFDEALPDGFWTGAS